MDDPIDRVEISGSTLAMALRELGSHTDTDGLLFGRLHTRSIQNFQDDGDSPAAPSRREEHTAIITGCCCSGTLMSFYDAAGELDDRKLERLVGNRQKWGGDTIIGWLLGRRSSSMRPSMREAAVTANLNARNPASPAPSLDREKKILDNSNSSIDLGLPYATSSRSSSISDSFIDRQEEKLGDAPALSPCLFLLLTETTAENSIQTHEYRAFQFQRQTRQFHPRLLVVRNVGRAGRSSEQGGLYGSFVPVSPLPWFSTSFGSSSTIGEEEEVDSWRSSSGTGGRGERSSSSLRQQQQQALLGMYAEGFSIDQLQNVSRCGGSVQEIELLYSRMLAKMQKIAYEVRQSSEAVQEKMTKIAKLRASQDHL
ncbi:uncharacterized protein LOC112349618 [Selaginella moellendorffii]|uniref:uncharacterized protein LOC112349618 n=1 Tax=Selaginella moellendorffii TaxID=88036 RepID=UPI000D1C3794|nr:uncharacterized protein LOC112349618 [Selaginella moellendorffii]|eukprot:XP_024540115.1 uncharacterized protein LOC112349618 [Selaginella moellendorffii]